MDKSIVFIIPNKKMVTTIKKVLVETGEDYFVDYGSTEIALQMSERKIKEGAKVIISMGLTAQYLRDNLKVPVLELILSKVEFMDAINEALRYSDKIAVIGSINVSYFAKKSAELLGDRGKDIKIERLEINKSIRDQVLKIIDKGYEVIISGSPGVETAISRGKIGILFDIEEKTIEFALVNAKALSMLEKEREEKNSIITTMINKSTEGLLVANSCHEINMLNPEAERIIGKSVEEIIGQNVYEVLKENNIINMLNNESFHDSNDASRFVIMNETSIFINNEVNGYIYSLRSTHDIREWNSAINQEHVLKGHIAKHTIEDIVGESEIIKNSKRKARLYALYDSTTMIYGETGTGKELFAQAIHNLSQRKDSAFVAVNCAAIPENLLESELYGYVKGAFTGARSEGKMGLFEVADKGTIFLDEISEIPIHMQARMLRAIQEKEIVRIGDNKIRKIDFRIITASNKNLLEMVMNGEFREDLYYRLCVLELNIPSLRERCEDIELISRDMINRKNSKLNLNISNISPDVIEEMKRMKWRGNIRELDNFIEKAMVLTQGDVINRDILNEIYYEIGEEKLNALLEDRDDKVLKSLQDIEKDAILHVLKVTGGNKSEAANILGINISTLWRKMKNIEN